MKNNTYAPHQIYGYITTIIALLYSFEASALAYFNTSQSESAAPQRVEITVCTSCFREAEAAAAREAVENERARFAAMDAAESAAQRARTLGDPSPGKKEKPIAPIAANNNEAPNCDNPTSQNPVIIATGEKYVSEEDFSAIGTYGLGLRRSYHSRSATSGMFGPKWSGAYSYSYPVEVGCGKAFAFPGYCIPTSVTYKSPAGSSYTYTRIGSSTTYSVRGSASAGKFSYQPEDSMWRLTIGATTITWMGARVTSVVEVGGDALLFNYTDATTRFSSISNRVGKTNTFTWSGNVIAAIQDSGGNTWRYGYNANGMLSSVTAPGSNPDVRTYFYENAVDNKLLTGIAINGIRYSTYIYDASKRVSHVSHTGGDLVDSFTYGTNQTTLTDVRGQTTTYTFANILGTLKVTNISRSATSTCAAAAATTVYDANGWIDYTFDWNGNKTDYSYDAAGHPEFDTQPPFRAIFGSRLQRNQ